MRLGRAFLKLAQEAPTYKSPGYAEMSDEDLLGRLAMIEDLDEKILGKLIQDRQGVVLDSKTGETAYDRDMKELIERVQRMDPQLARQAFTVLQNKSATVPALQTTVQQIQKAAPQIARPIKPLPKGGPGAPTGAAGVESAPQGANARDQFGTWYHVTDEGAVHRYDQGGNLDPRPMRGMNMAQLNPEQQKARQDQHYNQLWAQFQRTPQYRSGNYDEAQMMKTLRARAGRMVQEEMRGPQEIGLYRTARGGHPARQKLQQMRADYQKAVEAQDQEGAQKLRDAITQTGKAYQQDVATMESIGIPRWVAESDQQFSYDRSGNAYLTNPQTGKMEKVDSRTRWYLKNWEGKGKQRATAVARRRAKHKDPRYVANLMRTYDMSNTKRPDWMMKEMRRNPDFARQVAAHYTATETERRAQTGAQFDYGQAYEQAYTQLGQPRQPVKPPVAQAPQQAQRPAAPAPKPAQPAQETDILGNPIPPGTPPAKPAVTVKPKKPITPKPMTPGV